MSDKQHAHELLDRLASGQVAAVVHLLEAMVDQEVMIDQDDEEELTEEDLRALRATNEYFRNGGQGIPFEQVVSDLGFGMEQIRGVKKKQ